VEKGGSVDDMGTRGNADESVESMEGGSANEGVEMGGSSVNGNVMGKGVKM